ncbi:SIR2 family protein [Lactobacillus paragasseri]|uniref:SIR2 family protein n=1 Tax=Lactobacillus paragasseri TaxID=2107999 RepID=UPI00217D9ED6|nr:SIR2 family protein [Lactobacillus paragasseri]
MAKKIINTTRFLDDLQGKNINFLVGAGASAGLIRTLDIPLLEESFEDLYSLENLTSGQRKVLDFIWFQLWIKDTLVNREKFNEFSKKDDNRSKEKVKVIENYINFVNNLANFLDTEGYDKPKRANIFTTNYDSLFEFAFDKVSAKKRLVYFNDGSRGFFDRYISTENFNLNISHSAVTDNFQRSIPTINLLKIHGSITWDKSGDKIKVTMDPNVLENISKLASELNEEISNYSIIYKVFFTNDLTVEENLQSKLLLQLVMFYTDHEDKINAFITEYHKLQVVNPTKEKFSETVFQQNYYQMLRMLSFELEKKNSVLIVFGFSFADEHIREIIKRSLINPYLKVYIICYDKVTKEKIKDMFQDIQTNNIEYLPYSFEEEQYGQTSKIYGSFNYLNYLFDGSNNE